MSPEPNLSQYQDEKVDGEGGKKSPTACHLQGEVSVDLTFAETYSRDQANIEKVKVLDANMGPSTEDAGCRMSSASRTECLKKGGR